MGLVDPTIAPYLLGYLVRFRLAGMGRRLP
jgi:hypothetical protein